MLLNNECFANNNRFFFLNIYVYIIIFYYYYYTLPSIISIKWFHCVNTSWPLQRLKGLFLFSWAVRIKQYILYIRTHICTSKGWPRWLRKNTSWKPWTRVYACVYWNVPQSNKNLNNQSVYSDCILYKLCYWIYLIFHYPSEKKWFSHIQSIRAWYNYHSSVIIILCIQFI